MNETIPFHKPFPLSEDDIEIIQWKIADIIKTGQLTNGKNVRELEEEIRKLYNVKYAIATSNCTMGLWICQEHYHWLRPLHLSNFTWKSIDIVTSDEFKLYHDIDHKTWLMNDFEQAGVLIPVHTFGNVTKVKKDLINGAERSVIYDGAHSLGSELKDIGNATVFSLAATKIITSCEGGMIITNNRELAKYAIETRDIIARMSEPNAIFGLQYLPYLSKVMEWKEKVFDYYSEKIPGQFQIIPITSNYNTVGFLNNNKLKIPRHIQIKKYYDPLVRSMFKNSVDVRDIIVCLPSWYGVDYKKIVKDILEVNDEG